MKDHKGLSALALKVAQALNSNDSAAATSSAEEYMEQSTLHDYFDQDMSDATGPEFFWDNVLENLEVEIFNSLAKIIPDAAWNEDEMHKLVTTFIASLGSVKDEVVDKAESQARDSRAYSRDPYGYHGVKPEDF